MRKDQLYGYGGYDPDHPSGNVLDEFVHVHPDDPSKGVTAVHYDADGSTISEQKLTSDEVEFFFAKDGAPHPEISAVRAFGDAFIAERLPVLDDA